MITTQIGHAALAALAALVAVGACATDAPECSTDGGAACFALPDAPLAAYASDGSPRAVALGCGGLTATAIEQPITISGITRNPVSNTIVPNAQHVVFASTALDDVIATTTSNAAGTYSLSLPAGSPSVISMRLAARGHLPATLLRHAYDPSATSLELDTYLVTPDDADTHAGLIRATYEHDAGIAVAFAHDCSRSRLEHAVIVISSQPGRRAFIDNVVTAYTIDTALVPVLHSVQPDTSRQGAAGSLNVPVGTQLHAQAWGFPDAAALSQGEAGLALIDELPFMVGAGALVALELHAR